VRIPSGGELLDRWLWAFSRLFPEAPTAPWLEIPTGEGRIGPDWPARWAAARGATLRWDATVARLLGGAASAAV